MSTAAERFFTAWGEADATARISRINAAMVPNASYADPRTPAPINGTGEIADYVAMFSQNAPGAVAEVVKSDSQAGFTRVTVAFKMADGMLQHGQYFLEHDTQGLITRMVGFAGTGAPE